MGWGEDTKETKNALHARNIYPREAGRDECQTTKRIPSLSFLPAHIQKKPISCPSNTELAPNMT